MNNTSSDAFRQLRTSVQMNCHLADAEHARNYSLCIYLLKMREYYRWEKQLPLTETISREDVGDWVMSREEFWDDMEDQEFQSIPAGGECFDPFDEAAINGAIEADGLVYSSGLGRFGQPHFFLARLESVRRFDDMTVYVSAREYARDLTAPPAMALGKRIFVRRESLRRALWEMVDEAKWSKAPGAIARALCCYGSDGNDERAIDRMTDGEIDTLTWHEMGEVEAGQDLDPRWGAMIASITGVKTELYARAVRDHLADCLVTLPALLAPTIAAWERSFFRASIRPTSAGWKMGHSRSCGICYRMPVPTGAAWPKQCSPSSTTAGRISTRPSTRWSTPRHGTDRC